MAIATDPVAVTKVNDHRIVQFGSSKMPLHRHIANTLHSLPARLAPRIHEDSLDQISKRMSM
ncbi:hypothetical protein TYRP_014499 [Tyrophagus putrescentiae]|nr:hypothetical protein TYRP_014499 [Tyrophagus putrescentiae]